MRSRRGSLYPHADPTGTEPTVGFGVGYFIEGNRNGSRRRGLAPHSLRAARRTLRTAYASSGPYGGGADFEPSNPAERAPTPRALSERSTAESSQIIFSLAHPPIPTREVRTISMNALHELFDIVLR